MDFTYGYFKKTADYLKTIVPWEPEIALVLGTGLGPFAESIEDKIVVDYRDIPNFLVSTAPSHAGQLIFGAIAGKRVVCMSGASIPMRATTSSSWSSPCACSSCWGRRP